MTKNEFKMRALLAMCSGQVEDIDAMLKAAEDLANMAKSIVHFDEDDEPVETPRRLLADICDAVEKINRLNYVVHDCSETLKTMANSLAKLTADILDEEPDVE